MKLFDAVDSLAFAVYDVVAYARAHPCPWWDTPPHVCRDINNVFEGDLRDLRRVCSWVHARLSWRAVFDGEPLTNDETRIYRAATELVAAIDATTK